MLFDSNIIIYATQPGHAELHRLIINDDPAVSLISYIEVLGYHRLSITDRQLQKMLFALMDVLPINTEIAEKAVSLRQQRSISLGDSIIAATALITHQTLVTHNMADFQWVPDLILLDPLAG